MILIVKGPVWARGKHPRAYAAGEQVVAVLEGPDADPEALHVQFGRVDPEHKHYARNFVSWLLVKGYTNMKKNVKTISLERLGRV